MNHFFFLKVMMCMASMLKITSKEMQVEELYESLVHSWTEETKQVSPNKQYCY